ncbi:hypothetical protein SAMN05428939_6746 [Streptomyces sp. TLI_105]|nr:hypothetical protein SAMN05428939_6746 [Streptomyces sp. TLI_105]
MSVSANTHTRGPAPTHSPRLSPAPHAPPGRNGPAAYALTRPPGRGTALRPACRRPPPKESDPSCHDSTGNSASARPGQRPHARPSAQSQSQSPPQAPRLTPPGQARSARERPAAAATSGPRYPRASSARVNAERGAVDGVAAFDDVAGVVDEDEAGDPDPTEAPSEGVAPGPIRIAGVPRRDVADAPLGEAELPEQPEHHVQFLLIRERSGLIRGAFYSNFRTMEDLFFALFDLHAQGVIDRLTRAVDELDTIDDSLQAVLARMAPSTRPSDAGTCCPPSSPCTPSGTPTRPAPRPTTTAACARRSPASSTASAADPWSTRTPWPASPRPSP